MFRSEIPKLFDLHTSERQPFSYSRTFIIECLGLIQGFDLRAVAKWDDRGLLVR